CARLYSSVYYNFDFW
nr:immunoglobulin heavy chain junction region [Macaca mulatta]MOY17911.1 immunoglobulin heavy chain junction region [Macaca mulatta]MOY18174.1 immunoglobulin heavy chain junction region [Macaca mulatta]MOY18723.1 immunoglobulin heavy chain junction region [Macaca mulatta]MOY18953.1 immunoglobulin heavy chain junction region [Macaca mulatta]